ncbi:MAG TPA: OsmC family protein [Thermoplasmata archaeon]
MRVPAKFIYRGDLAPSAKVMKAHLVHLEGMRFRAKADDGHEILFDGGDEEARRGPSPMQATLLATMACTASDVVSILRKERVPFRGLDIEAEAERAKDVPRVFTKIHLHYRVRGDNIHEAAVKRAIDLSSEKYCSVGIMLRRAGVEFVNTHEILPMK